METKRLKIEKISMDYLDDINEFVTDQDTCKYMMFLPNKDKEEAKKYIQDVLDGWDKPNPCEHVFVLILDNKVIGNLYIYFEENNSAELGWIINKKFQNMGYAYESVSELIKYATKEYGIKHFVAHCDKDNAPSWHLMEKLGMKKVGEYGGRINRSSDEEKIELAYELNI